MDVHSPAEIPRITPRELKNKIDRGEDVLVLDVRSPRSYGASETKIKGAVRVDPRQIDEWASTASPDRETITY